MLFVRLKVQQRTLDFQITLFVKSINVGGSSPLKYSNVNVKEVSTFWTVSESNIIFAFDLLKRQWGYENGLVL